LNYENEEGEFLLLGWGWIMYNGSPKWEGSLKAAKQEIVVMRMTRFFAAVMMEWMVISSISFGYSGGNGRNQL
jgi:hypothetical protein